MPRTIYEIDTPGVTSLFDNRSGYSWDSSVRVSQGGSVVYQLATVRHLRITQSTSIGEVFFHRSYRGVRNKESRFVQFAFVKGGVLVIRAGGRDRTIPDGSFAVMKDGMSYSAHHLPNDREMEILVLAVPKHELPPLLDPNIDCEDRIETDPKIVDLIYGLSFLLFQSVESLSEGDVDQLLRILLDHIAQWVVQPIHYRGQHRSFDRRYKEIETYIRNNISDPNLGAGIIATELRISSRYLGMVVAKNGVNLREIINRYRIEKSKTLLNTMRAGKNGTIKEISAMVGYRNAAHFTSVFKQIVGVTPTVFMCSSDCSL